MPRAPPRNAETTPTAHVSIAHGRLTLCHLPIRADRYNFRVKIRSRLLTKVIVVVGVTLVRLLFKTCRLRTICETPGINPYESTGEAHYLFCVWHDQIVMTVFSGRPINMAGLVSGHQDGSYLAEAMKLLGIASVRGSSKRGGSRAMGELLQRAREFHVAITPDGPRGPRRKLKTGIVFLASHSGRAIIPTAYACRRGWRIRGNWTDMMIPWPFTDLHAHGGPPFVVPPGIDRDELERYVQRLEAEMQRLEALVAEAAATGRPDGPANSRPASLGDLERHKDARAARRLGWPGHPACGSLGTLETRGFRKAESARPPQSHADRPRSALPGFGGRDILRSPRPRPDPPSPARETFRGPFA